MSRRPFTFWIIFCWVMISAASLERRVFLSRLQHEAAEKSAPDILRSLRKGHPRLYVLDSDLPRVRELVKTDPLARRWHERLKADAEKILGQAPVEHKLIGPRLLSQSRAALERVSTLAGLYRLDGERRFAERARTEMLTAAAFSDWNPSHFLDVAEMTNALAIGYDWLFDFLSERDRTAVRTAIIEKGLKEGMKIYARGGWWTTNHNNWNQVCNGGLTGGALAIADEDPELAATIIAKARESIVIAMRMFGPDGGCEEGPGYWNYATRYNVFYLSALETTLDTDFGFKAIPGFADTGMFRIHSTGSLQRTFNYADAREHAGDAAQMFWLAREFNRPLYAAHERWMSADHPDIFHVLWFDGRGQLPQDDQPSRDAVFRGVNVAFFRSAWQDPAAIYIGFKGGDNRASHSHLDLGAFVLDASAERWALDLGPDDYNLPAYFGNLRWTYYRLRTEGHNTLTLDSENQIPAAKASLVAFSSEPEDAFAVADLSQAYEPKAKSVRRGIALLKRRQILVQDEIEILKPAQITWNFHTRAKIQIDKAQATLTQGKALLRANILSPEKARFEVVSANPAPPQAQQPDVSNLVIRLPGQGRVTIAVLLSPAQSTGTALTLEPLDRWIARASSR